MINSVLTLFRGLDASNSSSSVAKPSSSARRFFNVSSVKQVDLHEFANDQSRSLGRPMLFVSSKLMRSVTTCNLRVFEYANQR